MDQERLQLDDPVEKHLADFPHGAITLRQLAGHLAGIRHYSEAEFLNSTHYESATDSLRKFAADPLLAPPGEKYAYSSYGYDVLGAVIEHVTKERFDEAVRELVLAPLAMTSTSFAADERTAAFYDAGQSGPRASPATDLSDRLPAGAALSTAGDLARLLMAMGGEGFLSAGARAEMARSQRTADGTATQVGIAWRIGSDASGRTFLHHGGAVTGGRAFALLYPAERVSVAIVTNLGFARFDEEGRAPDRRPVPRVGARAARGSSRLATRSSLRRWSADPRPPRARPFPPATSEVAARGVVVHSPPPAGARASSSGRRSSSRACADPSRATSSRRSPGPSR